MQIEVIKNGEIKKVSRSAFKNFFENNGWVESNGSTQPIISNEEQMNDVEQKEEISEVLEEEATDEDWGEEDEETEEKPLSEMNRNELTAMAEKLGIDVSGISKNAQLREAIKAAM